MDCFAALAMTERVWLATHGGPRPTRDLAPCRRTTLPRHCLRQTRSVCARERSDEAIHSFFARRDGLLRCARNDGEGVASDSWRSSSHPRFSSLPPDHITPSLRGATATKQSIFLCAARWIASLRSQ